MKKDAYLNEISLAVPEHDIHRKFIDFAPSLLKDDRSRALFRRMAERCQIDHRYSCINPHVEAGKLDRDGFYGANGFPDTQMRMKLYQQHAFSLARKNPVRIAESPKTLVGSGAPCYIVVQEMPWI
jgi:hypothetical protein